MSATTVGAGRTVELLLLRSVEPDTTPIVPADKPTRAAGRPAVGAFDDTPRTIILTERQRCVVMSETDAALLVLAVAAAFRPETNRTAGMTGDEMGRVRRVATLLHRSLAHDARAAVRTRAKVMSAAHSAGRTHAAA